MDFQSINSIPVVVVSSIVSGVIALIVCYVNKRLAEKSLDKSLEANQKKLETDVFSLESKTYKELITSQRIEWLNLLRESMAEYMARMYLLLNLKANKDFLCNNTDDAQQSFVQKQFEPHYQVVKASFLIQLRLNPKQSNHVKLVKDMNQLDRNVSLYLQGYEELSVSEVASEVMKFALSCQELLKQEWELVKKEANPQRNSEN